MTSHAGSACWNISIADFPFEATLSEWIGFLVHYAILAPSSHNSQPWKFKIRDNRIDVLIDFSCWLNVADEDQRELHISAGCALENLLVAAEHFGLGHETVLFPDADDPSLAATITFRQSGTPTPHRPAVLFDMIPVRHTNHGRYEERPVPEENLEQLQSLCVEDGIRLVLTGDDEIKQQVDELVVRGDAIQFSDPDFRAELAYWIGQGAFGTGWLMSKLSKLAVSYLDLGDAQAKKDSRVLMSSPVLGLLAVEDDDRLQQLRVGQVYQRLSLLAASHGIWFQPMSQIVEVPELKQRLSELISQPGLIPQHPFRIGYAPAETHRTPRRPLEEVLAR